MKKLNIHLIYLIAFNLILLKSLFAQAQQGHTNQNKFRQLYDEFAEPNKYHNASGAPGVEYFQQKVDYVMDIELDDKNSKLYGEEEITYTNNSPDNLTYLWLQLDQNIRKKDAPSLEKNSSGNSVTQRPSSFLKNYVNGSHEHAHSILLKAIEVRNSLRQCELNHFLSNQVLLLFHRPFLYFLLTTQRH